VALLAPINPPVAGDPELGVVHAAPLHPHSLPTVHRAASGATLLERVLGALQVRELSRSTSESMDMIVDTHP
jgi:hypothetical protein